MSSSIILQEGVELKIIAQENHLKKIGTWSIVLVRGWIQLDSPFSDHIGRRKLPIGNGRLGTKGSGSFTWGWLQTCSLNFDFCSTAFHTPGIFLLLCFHLQWLLDTFPRHMEDTFLFLFVTMQNWTSPLGSHPLPVLSSWASGCHVTQAQVNLGIPQQPQRTFYGQEPFSLSPIGFEGESV